MSDPRDDVYRVAALLADLDRVLNPLPRGPRGGYRVEPPIPPPLPSVDAGGPRAGSASAAASAAPAPANRSTELAERTRAAKRSAEPLATAQRRDARSESISSAAAKSLRSIASETTELPKAGEPTVAKTQTLQSPTVTRASDSPSKQVPSEPPSALSGASSALSETATKQASSGNKSPRLSTEAEAAQDAVPDEITTRLGRLAVPSKRATTQERFAEAEPLQRYVARPLDTAPRALNGPRTGALARPPLPSTRAPRHVAEARRARRGEALRGPLLRSPTSAPPLPLKPRASARGDDARTSNEVDEEEQLEPSEARAREIEELVDQEDSEVVEAEPRARLARRVRTGLGRSITIEPEDADRAAMALTRSYRDRARWRVR